MFDRPFELSFEEGHRQTKLKKDKLVVLGGRQFYREQFNQEAQLQMEQNGELVDFERGSTFGGLVTAVVFVGLIYLIISDLQENINNKPYAFKVQDKYMTPEEHIATRLNLADFKFSQDIVVGFEAYSEDGSYDPTFNPLDNDYIDVISTAWNTDLNSKEGKYFGHIRDGPELELCSKDRIRRVVDSGAVPYRNNFLCYKDKQEAWVSGDWPHENHQSIHFTVAACDPKKRTSCKSR